MAGWSGLYQSELPCPSCRSISFRFFRFSTNICDTLPSRSLIKESDSVFSWVNLSEFSSAASNRFLISRFSSPNFVDRAIDSLSCLCNVATCDLSSPIFPSLRLSCRFHNLASWLVGTMHLKRAFAPLAFGFAFFFGNSRATAFSKRLSASVVSG